MVEAVDMIDAEARDQALRHQAEGQAVHAVEHLRVLDPQGDEIVDGEEAAVVDLLHAHAPEGQPVILLGQQGGEAS